MAFRRPTPCLEATHGKKFQSSFQADSINFLKSDPNFQRPMVFQVLFSSHQGDSAIFPQKTQTRITALSTKEKNYRYTYQGQWDFQLLCFQKDLIFTVFIDQLGLYFHERRIAWWQSKNDFLRQSHLLNLPSIDLP